MSGLPAIRHEAQIIYLPLALTWGAYLIGLLSSFFAYLYLRREFGVCASSNIVINQLISNRAFLQLPGAIYGALGIVCVLDWYRLLYACVLALMGLNH